MKEVERRKAYMYLGIEERHDIQHKNEKEKLKKGYLRKALGSLAVPVLQSWNY
jgi:hypothetical protein